jgi:hypothetical protein
MCTAISFSAQQSKALQSLPLCLLHWLSSRPSSHSRSKNLGGSRLSAEEKCTTVASSGAYSVGDAPKTLHACGRLISHSRCRSFDSPPNLSRHQASVFIYRPLGPGKIENGELEKVVEQHLDILASQTERQNPAQPVETESDPEGEASAANPQRTADAKNPASTAHAPAVEEKRSWRASLKR